MIQYPLFVIPTLKATRKTILICNSLYGKKHHQNGRENAFRHAIWNVLICQKTFKISKKEEKSMLWAQKVTDLHEKLAPNPPLEEAMDLHNNNQGRIYYLKLKNASEEEVMRFLEDKTKMAKVISKIEEVDRFTNDLVYLSDTITE